MNTSLACRVFLFFLGSVSLLTAQATELPTGLSRNEARRIGRNLTRGSVHRSWTAPAIEGESLGLELGLEGAFVWRGDTLELGDKNGVLPRVVPIPRVWVGADLGSDFQVSSSFGPGFLYDGVTTFGLGGQWAFHRGENYTMSLTGAYSYVGLFGDMTAHVLSVDGQIARDLGGWQPYLILGVEFNEAKADERIMAAGQDEGWHALHTFHAGVGVQLLFPAKLAVQLDFHGQKFSAGLLLAKRF